MYVPTADRPERSVLARLVVVLALLVTLLAPSVRSGGATPTETWGYATVRDGVRLRYTAVSPGPGTHPVALIFSPYADGVGPTQDYPIGEDAVIARTLLEAGYVVVGVNMRGTGCSGGQWDLFQPASDGYDVVEWAAAQPWSNGAVGMFGFSAPGMSQILTAATKPPHLRAVAPADVAVDLYRDVAYPGGIMNAGFISLWNVAYRPGISHLSAIATAQGDTECLANMAARQLNDDLRPNDTWEALTAIEHPFDDALWSEYGLTEAAKSISVPVLTCQAWQDDQVGPRAGSSWYSSLDPKRSWLVFTNGAHGTCDDFEQDPFQDTLVSFFDRYVKGVSNGFDASPHVQIWHETAGTQFTNATPGWTTTQPSWPVRVKERTLFLRSGGQLQASAPKLLEGADPYVYPLPSSSVDDSEFQQSHAAWKIPNAPTGFVTYTTPKLAKDLEVFGPASLDLWMKSTAPDTDLQVTLTEVRSDGQEVYLARGWLRASHRTLDATRSTALRPYHTHRAADARALVPGLPTFVRVEVGPLGHVFRGGSALRVYVEAPTGVTGEHGFAFLPAPAINTVLHDSVHPSRLVLGAVRGTAATPLPACDTVFSEPCRPNTLGVPSGLLTLPDV